MVHGTASLSQVKHGTQGAGQICLGPLHGQVHGHPFCQVRGNGAGKGAAGSMGVGIVNPLAVKPLSLPVHVQQVIGIILLMASLAQNGTSAPVPY